VGLNWNGTHQLLAYADDVTLLGDNIDTSLLDATEEVGEIYIEETKNMHLCLVTRMQGKTMT
jgi:hypothetical protein